jgi:RHS repeat-associated protein
MHELTRSLPGRTLALALAIGIAALGCQPRPSLGPADGAPEYQLAGLIAVPGGAVNAAGGNLMIERLDMSIDTVLGTREIRAVYNAHSGDWLWSFQVTYDGSEFRDPTGARHDLDAIADGAAIPGTVYVKADADTIETKGGWAFHFDANGKLSYVGWKTADYPRLQYIRTGDLLEIEQCPGASSCLLFYSIALNPAGDPLSVTDARTGRIAEFQYDGLGRLVVARDALAVDEGWPGFRYEYSLGGTLLTAITNSEGERIEYAYQGNRRIRDVIQIGEGNPTHRFGYSGKDAAGLYKALHTNPLGALTRYIVDGQRRLHRVELADAGEATAFTWAGRRPASLTLPSGVTTFFTYVGDDLASVVQPSGNVVTTTYEPGAVNFDNQFASAIARIEDSLGLVEERSYDAQGRVETISNGEGDTFSSTYSEATLASITNPQGAQFSFPFYGVHGHWLRMQGDASDQRSHDLVGNALVTSVQRQLGGLLIRGFDASRNVSSYGMAATAQGFVTSQGSIAIARRSDGQVTSIARPGGADHDFEHDALGRIIRRHEHVGGVWQTTTLEYDALGNLTARERPNGMREEFDYDGYGRLQKHRALRDAVLEGEATFTYQRGQLVSFADSTRNATEVYGYDTAGRLQTILFGFGEMGTLEYDLRSRLTAEVFVWPGQGPIRRIDYAYDLANRPVQVTADGAELLGEWAYQNGNVRTARTGNGLSRELAYDPASGRLATATTTNALAEVVESTTVTLTAEVGPSRQQFTVQTATLLASTEEQYWMALGGSIASPDEFVGKRIFAWNDGNGGSKSFAYDELSNLRSNAEGDTFNYNAEGNRLLSATLVHEGASLTYAYDEAGFAISRNGIPITWTATGRMASFASTSIEWDMRGRPISWTATGVAREFIFFGGRVDSDPQTGALGSLDLGFVSIPFGSGARTYRHVDFRGNVSFATDENGEVVAHHSYSPYGLDATFGSSADPVGFAGRTEIGDLMLLGARVYDPAVGRFLSPDPVFQLINAYAYTLGNPVWFWDPDGAEQAASEGPSKTQIRSAYEAWAKAFGLVTVVAAATGNAPLAAAAATTAGAIVVALEIDAAIDAFGGGAGLLGALGLPDFGAGPCRGSRCDAPCRSSGGCGGPEDAARPPRFNGPSEFGPGQSDASFTAPPPAPPPAACAPATLTRAPDLGWILPISILLQLVLGAFMLNRRGVAGERREGD